MWCRTLSRPHTLLSEVTFPLQTFHDTQTCLCLFVLCHPAAPDESENVVQSDETENGILLSHLIKILSEIAL